MAFEQEDLDLEDGPILFEEGPHTVGVRLLDETEPEHRNGYVVELALWVQIDGLRVQVGSAFVDREAKEVDIWMDDHDDVDESDPAYIEAIHRFDQVVTNFVQTSRALMELDRDLDAWATADPDNPFGDSEPAEDPVDYDKINRRSDPVADVMAQFGVTVEPDGTIKGIYSLNDEDRQRLYVELRKLQRENDEEEEW